MPLKNYGVLKGRPISSRLGTGSSPHYQIHVVDNTTDYRIAVNVKSKLAPSELFYVVKDNLQHPISEELKTLAVGFARLASEPAAVRLTIFGQIYLIVTKCILSHTIFPVPTTISMKKSMLTYSEPSRMNTPRFMPLA